MAKRKSTTKKSKQAANAQNGGIVVKNQYSGKCLDTGVATSGNNMAALTTYTCATQSSTSASRGVRPSDSNGLGDSKFGLKPVEDFAESNSAS